jgi:tetratricopeptide (TPR) repeat protein
MACPGDSVDLAAWFQELRRRRVIRALLAWGLFSFAVLQVVEPVQHALGLADWVLKVAVAVLALGFPVSAGLAWAFDLTRKGIERTAPPEGSEAAAAARREGVRPAVAMVAVGALLGAAVAGFAGWHLWGRSPASGPDGRITVAVADFVNETKDGDLDGLSGQLITSLEQSQKLRVLTRSRMVDVLRQIGKPSVPFVDEVLGREMARAAGVRALVVASIRRFDQLYAIDLKVLDPATSEYFFTLKEEREGKAAIPAMLDRLSEKAREKLRETPAEVGASRIAVADATTRSYEAWQHYFEGLKLEDDSRSLLAVEQYRKAVAADPRFALAHYRIAWLGEFIGVVDMAERRSAMEAALREIDRLPAKERLLMQAWKAHLEERQQDAHALYAQAAVAYPQDKEVQYLAGDLYLHEGRNAEALPYFERAMALDPLWPHSLYHLILHLLPDLGRGDEALALARQWAEKAPTPYSRGVLIAALHRSGLPEQAVDVARRFMAMDPGSRARANLAESLILADRFEEAETLVRPFAGETASWMDRRGAVPLLATALAHQGRRREALAVVGTLGRIPDSGDTPDVHWLPWQLLVNERDQGPALREAAAIQKGGKAVDRLYSGLFLLGDDRGAEEVASKGLDSWDRDLKLGLEAWHRGDFDAAVARIQDVVRRDARRRGPASWWLAYVAFDARQDTVAIAATEDYERDQGQCDPWRSWGLARLLYKKALARERMGDLAAAAATTERLLGWWTKADPDLPLLAEARAACRRLGCKAPATSRSP